VGYNGVVVRTPPQRNLKYKHDVNVTALAVRNRLCKVTYYYFAPMRRRSIANTVSVYDCH